MKEDRKENSKPAVDAGKRGLLMSLAALLTISKIKDKVVLRKADGSVARAASHQGAKS